MSISFLNDPEAQTLCLSNCPQQGNWLNFFSLSLKHMTEIKQLTCLSDKKHILQIPKFSNTSTSFLIFSHFRQFSSAYSKMSVSEENGDESWKSKYRTEHSRTRAARTASASDFTYVIPNPILPRGRIFF